jgi:Cu(I)/Ag(I) efflux system membrane fusion protein
MNEEFHPPQSIRPRRILASLVFLVLGAAAGAGLVWAHFSGHLAPSYHDLGLRSAHQKSEQAAESGQPTQGGHAGHDGLSVSKTGGAESSKIPGYSVVMLTPGRQQLIGVRTGKVEKDRLLMSIRAVGIIEPDQRRLARIHTRISGWVTKVHVNFVGQNVKKGDLLLELYSPELMQSQLEFLRALDNWEAQGKTEPMRQLVEASRRRLELWGVHANELQELEKNRQARESLRLRSPISGRVLERNVQEGSYVEPAADLYRIADLSTVWLQAKIYEYELPHIEIGQPVHISVPARPDLKDIQGKVSFVEPVFQEATRTVKVRVAIENPKDVFKPGMYADLVIDHDMGEGLLAPESGLLRTGVRVLAFRVLPENRFEPVEIAVGARFGERVQVLSGLGEGDVIVTSAAFLIDAESRLKSATASTSGHQHGSAPKEKKSESPPIGGGKGHEHNHGH